MATRNRTNKGASSLRSLDSLRLSTWGVVLGVALIAAPAAAAEAPITSVVVYADRAQITRSHTVDCRKGQAVFSGLPSTLDPKTLSARITAGSGEVVGLKHDDKATGPRPGAKALQERLRLLDVAIKAVDGELAAARGTEGKLESFGEHLRRTWKLQATQRKAPVSSWDQALDLIGQQRLRAARQRIAAQSRRRELQRKRRRLARELSQIRRARRRTTTEVTAMLRCSGSRKVALSYVVPDATWRVAYQVRASSSGRVELLAQAIVQQGTGEDWRDVRLAVSTANLQRRNTPPVIRAMRVSTRKPRSTRKVLTRRFERRTHLKAGAGTISSRTAALSRQQRRAGPVAPGQREQLALELTAAARTSVPADGRQVVVTLARRALAGKVALETVPKLYPYVYRKVELKNPFSFPMLAGEASLFSGRTFLGKAKIKLRAPGEPFSVSLGVDNQLQVKRYVKREKLEGAGVFDADKRLLHRYVLEVGNWSRKRQRVRVLENIPVSQVGEIKISLRADSTKPTRWNKADGILTWELSIPPRSKRKVVIDYAVALPKSYVVRGYR